MTRMKRRNKRTACLAYLLSVASALATTEPVLATGRVRPTGGQGEGGSSAVHENELVWNLQALRNTEALIVLPAK